MDKNVVLTGRKKVLFLDLGPMRSLDFKGLVVPAVVVEETSEEKR